MNCALGWREMNYSSTFTYRSRVCAGVEMELKRISFARRSELIAELSPMVAKLEFLAASDKNEDRTASALLRRQISQYLLEWGVVRVVGLEIDGVAASKKDLIESGPEGLVQEAVEELQRQLALSEQEKKN